MSATSNSTDPVQATVDLLEGAASSVWTHADPDVFNRWETTQQHREQYAQPAIYVWSPIEGTFDRLSADNAYLDETQTIECSVWVLNDASENSAKKCADYGDDLIQFLSSYGNDNEAKTSFHGVNPTNVNDLRAENIPRQSDHFLVEVQAEFDNLRETGV